MTFSFMNMHMFIAVYSNTYLCFYSHLYIYVSIHTGVYFYKWLIFPRVKILKIIYECTGNIFIKMSNKLFI